MGLSLVVDTALRAKAKTRFAGLYGEGKSSVVARRPGEKIHLKR